MKSALLVFVVFVAVLSLVQAFSNPMRTMSLHKSSKSMARYMSDDAEPDFIPPAVEMESDAKLFDMNRRVRLGRSRDQDGKSNIWSIEPTMQVEEEEEGGVSKNVVVGLSVLVAALVSLPLFSSLSSLLPDPSDF
jgi:hypothetical protein